MAARKDSFRDKVAVAGVGFSRLDRDAGLGLTALGVEAGVNAIRDAGLKAPDIDGLATMYPPQVFDLIEGVGLDGVTWFYNCEFGPGAMPTIIDAALAVAAGMCNAALVVRTIVRPRPHGLPPAEAQRAQQIVRGITAKAKGYGYTFAEEQFRLSYGASTIPALSAPWMRLYMEKNGVTPEQMAAVPITFRKHASLNERAVMRTPITVDDYLASRFICEPLRLLDCDLPIDGAGAAVLVPAERARDLPHPPVYISAATLGTGGKSLWEQWYDFGKHGGGAFGDRIWARAGLSPQDVDVAQLYDGFSFFVPLWLEALGLCKKDEGHEFIQDGRIAIGGELPVNTSGGQLSEGRLMGMGLFNEAVLQLRGQCGVRQVEDARVAVMSGGGLANGGVVVLRQG
ncbi:MAG: thiolase family protein [Chloroflexi bacterium]|nr:thiolase family protein [Chloroflexota bacterium]